MSTAQGVPATHHSTFTLSKQHVAEASAGMGQDKVHSMVYLIQLVLLGKGNCLAPSQSLLVDECADAPEFHELVLLKL